MRDTLMQKHCSELTEKLLKSLDKEYNVRDMRAVLEVISALERTTITKELLESTRLGKHINELRRKTRNEALAKRAKDLVRRWRDMVLPSVHSTPQPTVADTAPPALNGAKEMALRNLKPQSPALRGLNPHSPLSLKDTIPLRVLSPALSLHSDHSRSPNASSNSKQSIISTNNHKISSSSRNASPVLSSSSQNHTTEAVPRTHSSNKRLRKEEISKDHYRSLYGVELTMDDGLVKRQRLNGENISGNLNLQVPSPTLKERISSDRFAENSHEATDEDTGPKKRGRKKGSKLPKRPSLLEDSVKEKLASISRNPKLKTTQELLADLQSRGSTTDCSLIGDESTLPSQSVAEPPRMEDVLRGSSNDQVSKYLSCSNQNSQNLHKISSESSGSGKTSRSRENCRELSPESCEDRLRESNRSTDIGESSTCRSPSRRDLTVEEILAKLPPLDPSSIDWGEDEAAQNYAACPTPPPREVTAEDLERLHTQCVEGLNGNWQPRLLACSDSDDKRSSNARNEEDRTSFGLSSDSVKSVNNNQQTADDIMEFREWHQMLARSSYQGDILHIMPYVIID